MKRLAFVLPALLLGTSLPAMAQDARSIVAQWDQQFSDAFNKRDVKGLSTLFAADAYVIPPIVPSGRGPEFAVKFWSAILADKWSNHTGDVIEVSQVADNTVVAVSRWAATLSDNGGKNAGHHGDSAQVFTKVGGQWKARVLTWSLLPDD